MKRFSVPIFRSWAEASGKGFFTKTTWKKRGHDVSKLKLEPDGVVILKTHRISAERDTWMVVIEEDGDELIVTEEWFDVFSEKLVLEGSSAVVLEPGDQLSVVSKIEEVPETVLSPVPKVSPKRNKEGGQGGGEQGVHYDGKTSEKTPQPIDNTTTYNPNNSANNTPNWIPRTYPFQDIDNQEVKEGLMRLSNLIFLKAHDYPTLLKTFVPLKKQYLRNQFGRDAIEDIIRLGLRTGLIETDKHYQVGVKSIGYRIGEQFREAPFRIINVRRAVREEKDLKELLAHNPHLRYLHTHLTSLTIDERVLSRFRSDWDIFEPCQSIIAKAFYFTEDDFSGRIHTNLTNLKKKARGLLRIDNGTESLWEVDMTNSQPLIAGFAARAKGFNDEAYVSVCEQGALYETLGASWGVSRDEAKHETLRLFYSKNGYRSKRKSHFEEMFPTFSKFMRQTKSVKHQRFAELAQREERKMIIDSVVPEIIRKCPGAFLATVHDSFLVQERHVEIVRDVLTTQFLGKYAIVPPVKVKNTAEYLGSHA